VKESLFLGEALMALIQLCIQLLHKETFFFVVLYYVFKKFIAILLLKINYELNMKPNRLYVKIKSYLFKIIESE